MPADHMVSKFLLEKTHFIVIAKREELSINDHEFFEITDLIIFLDGGRNGLERVLGKPIMKLACPLGKMTTI